jgi:hypothetical protein
MPANRPHFVHVPVLLHFVIKEHPLLCIACAHLLTAIIRNGEIVITRPIVPPSHRERSKAFSKPLVQLFTASCTNPLRSR